MTTILIGFACLLVAGLMSLDANTVHLYFQWHSFWLVGMGSIAVMFLTSPLAVIKSLARSLPKMVQKEKSLKDYDEALRSLAKDKFKPIAQSHPVLDYAQQLWEQGINPDLFVVLLSEKRTELDSANVDAIHVLKNLTKYPPALGMVGTVMGMIDLFSALDKNQDKIGYALSIAMTATFLGLIIANFFISPLADRLHVQHIKEQRLNTTLYELMLLINSRQPVSLIDEEIKTRAG